MTDSEFYTRDRPKNPRLPEDRPRGGGPKGAPAGYRGLRTTTTVVIIIVAVVILGIMLFP
ncbi:hypothetical protein ABZ707_28865 [Streptomyces sp. NPDC006923]|uniref:hypothetical protein n=1 Tax=Streptomyces sp. NPDC006923 TaxID=3155355 RepID=UPI003411663C